MIPRQTVVLVISFCNKRKKAKGCEIVHDDELGRFRPDGYVVGKNTADVAKE